MSFLSSVRALWRNLLLKSKVERELDDELQAYLAMVSDEKASSGISTKKARRLALIEFGGVEQVKGAVRERRLGYGVEVLLQDARYALRGFRRNPLFTATVIVTLALGIGATTAVFSVVDPILFRSLPYAHADRLVSVGLVQSLEKDEFTLGSFFFDWQENQKPFEALTSQEVFVQHCDLTERNPANLNCAQVQANFLPTLGILPVLGRNFLPEEDRPDGPKVALISYGFWLTHFNRDPGIVNRLINLDGNQVRVVGVLPKDFEMPTLDAAEVLLPMALDKSAQHTVNGGIGMPMRSFARLKPGVSIEQAQAEMEPLFEYVDRMMDSVKPPPPPQIRNDFHIKVRSLRDRQMQNVSLVAWVLLGAALAVLLIACANVASLLMTRGAARERELAVRSALGASRGRLVRQALTEALLLSIAGAVAGCALAEILLRVFIAIAPASVPFLSKARLDLRISLFTVAVSLVCAVLFGLTPALQKPRATAIVARSTNSGIHAVLRRSLVVAQIAISMILLSSASLLLRSFRNLQEQNLGMRTHNVLTINIPLATQKYGAGQKSMDFFLKAEAALRSLPGVTAVGISDSLPPDGWHGGNRYASMSVVGRPAPPAGTGGTVVRRWVTPDYFQALEIPILQGRGFTEEERSSSDHFIILSKLLASRMFPGENPIGKRIEFDSDKPPYTVVGIAANVKNGGLAGQEDPEYYLLRGNFADDWGLHTVIVLETAFSPLTVAPWVRSQIARIDLTAPVEIETLAQRVSTLADRPRFATALLGFFAFTGLLMAVIGLYGVISFIATQRTQEIGVRMALGAGRFDILRLITWEGVRLIALGGAVGLGTALGMSRLLKSLLFSVGPHDPVSFIGVALLLTLVALAATLIPARAAMKVEPVVALRYE